MTFGVDNSSLSYIDNLKSNCLVLGEGDTFGINGSFGAPEIKFSINFSEANTNFCLLMEKKSLNLKPTKKMLTFQLHFVREVYLSDLVLRTLVTYL